ncbi:MAG: YkgJ family cysteine cluster protein [Gemmatimonadota bacterium]|nr:YkgJ family cysteine cluster protein [Gemmatimonadota bacterium]
MTDTGRTSPAGYRALLDRLDRWFAEARARHPGVIPCGGGCSTCCHGPFDISVADAELLVAAVRALPAVERAAVRSRAAALMERFAEQLPGWSAPHDIADVGDDAFDQAVSALRAEPCPLLGPGGACLIYADRPMICRLIGLSMVTPAGRVIENMCPIQEQFPAYEALPPMQFDLEDLEVDELEALQAAARRLLGDASRGDYETTIAAAIVDFTD